MPTYRITDPTSGRALKLTGDSPPTEQELEGIFAQTFGEQETPPALPVDTPPALPPEPGFAQLPSLATAAEPALQIATGLGASAVGGLSALGTLATGGGLDLAAKRLKSVQKAGTYQPRTERGQEAAELINLPFEKAAEGWGMIGGEIGEAFGEEKGRAAGEALGEGGFQSLAILSAKPWRAAAKIQIIPEALPVGAMRKSINFSPGIEPALQTRVANTALRESVIPTKRSYGKFIKKLSETNKEVQAKIAPKADVPIKLNVDAWVRELLEKAKTSGERSLDTKAINKFVEQFKTDHTILTVGQAQKAKISLHKKLESYYKRRAAGGTVGRAARSDAMAAVAKGLRAEIERFVPEVKGLNARVADMIVAKPFLKVAANKAGNMPILSTRDFVAGAVGHQVGGSFGGAIGTAGSRILRDPRVMGGMGLLAKRLRGVKKAAKSAMTQEEAAILVESLEVTLRENPAIKGLGNESLRDLQTPTFQRNQLAVSSQELPAGPSRAAGTINSYDRIFQIAQSPEGMRLLVERLGREQKYTQLLNEVLKIPEQLALPAGQGFELSTQAQGMNALAMRRSGTKTMPTSTLGGISRQERIRLNNLTRGLSPENR